MASGSSQYSYVNKLRGDGGGNGSAASRRSPVRDTRGAGRFDVRGNFIAGEDAPF